MVRLWDVEDRHRTEEMALSFQAIWESSLRLDVLNSGRHGAVSQVFELSHPQNKQNEPGAETGNSNACLGQRKGVTFKSRWKAQESNARHCHLAGQQSQPSTYQTYFRLSSSLMLEVALRVPG